MKFSTSSFLVFAFGISSIIEPALCAPKPRGILDLITNNNGDGNAATKEAKKEASRNGGTNGNSAASSNSGTTGKGAASSNAAAQYPPRLTAQKSLI